MMHAKGVLQGGVQIPVEWELEADVFQSGEYSSLSNMEWPAMIQRATGCLVSFQGGRRNLLR